MRKPSLHFETRAFSYQVLFSTNLCSKREEGEFHNLEALDSAWNTDDGDTVYNADYKIRDCHFPNDGGDLLNFVLVNKKLFAKLHEYRLSNVIIDFLLYTNKYEEDRQDNEYISHYTCFGYLGLMYQWYRNGFKESPAEICDIIRNKYIEILDEINKKRNND